ncbi:hypothetical protein I3842_03G166400 [Carya illinoinensis]|uniref:Uncharacterized protein n=1 Tax=Carya illinoinensis TaxID=32201 RepID=A0A922JZ19_CARIL|nr:hypothetical protein I3842_03G166400 [Carya illinoinensis]
MLGTERQPVGAKLERENVNARNRLNVNGVVRLFIFAIKRSEGRKEMELDVYGKKSFSRRRLAVKSGV